MKTYVQLGNTITLTAPYAAELSHLIKCPFQFNGEIIVGNSTVNPNVEPVHSAIKLGDFLVPMHGYVLLRLAITRFAQQSRFRGTSSTLSTLMTPPACSLLSPPAATRTSSTFVSTRNDGSFIGIDPDRWLSGNRHSSHGFLRERLAHGRPRSHAHTVRIHLVSKGASTHGCRLTD